MPEPVGNTALTFKPSQYALPTPVFIRDAAPASVQTLRERCSALGLPTWHCDSSGVILQEPIEQGTLAILLGSKPMTRLITEHARRWSQQETPEVEQFFPGCWGIPLAEIRRRDRVGTLVAMAIGPEALNDEVFVQMCASAHLDAQATRRALLPRTRFDLLTAKTTRDLLLFMAQDLTHLDQHDSTSASFTRQLTDCYETIDLLYKLGRSMKDLDQPESFLLGTCERLQETLTFGYIGVSLVDDHRLGSAVAGRLFSAGRMNIAADLLRRELLTNHHMPSGVRIFTKLASEPIPGAGQILAVPVPMARSTAGFFFAGDKKGDDNQVSSYDIQLLEAAAGYAGAFLDNSALYADQQRLFLGTLEALTAAIDAKDPYTCGHSLRVAHLASHLALAVGYTPEQADRVRIAGLVHDVGKIGVPEAVLTKTGRLTDVEFAWIKKHPEIGHRILRDIDLLSDVLPGVLYHHERWDGTGYPHRLHSQNIPLLARLLTLADTFDAMSSSRSYRSALPRDAVLSEFRRCAGSQFDPALIEPFLSLDFSEYDRMLAQAAAQARRAA